VKLNDEEKDKFKASANAVRSMNAALDQILNN